MEAINETENVNIENEFVENITQTQKTRKPRLPKEKAKQFVNWLKQSELKHEKPKIIHSAYLEETGEDLNLGFIRNMKRMINIQMES